MTKLCGYCIDIHAQPQETKQKIQKQQQMIYTPSGYKHIEELIQQMVCF